MSKGGGMFGGAPTYRRHQRVTKRCSDCGRRVSEPHRSTCPTKNEANKTDAYSGVELQEKIDRLAAGVTP